jgi:hypothetical protein
MIKFQTWLSQIVGYCQFIVDTVGLRRAWINQNFSHTSVTNFDELYEQIFDDLDSDNIEKELAVYLGRDTAATRAVSEFLESIRVVDNQRETDMQLSDPRCLLQSEEWLRVVRAAEQVVEGLGRDLGAAQS